MYPGVGCRGSVNHAGANFVSSTGFLLEYALKIGNDELTKLWIDLINPSGKLFNVILRLNL